MSARRRRDAESTSACCGIAVVHADSRSPICEQGRSNPETHLILKQAIAREVYKLLCRPNSVTSIEDLRRTRREKNLPLRQVVEALGTSQVHVSRIERGLTYDQEFTDRCREWLSASSS